MSDAPESRIACVHTYDVDLFKIMSDPEHAKMQVFSVGGDFMF